ncbi:MAG: DNA polymerase/3'-5' exonuclease PolX [Gemmatales bacterium]|nr:DNA polymerase/3'-5' exonuclease PolX [Gemmatales bacterium]MDW8387690.1 DNA polymerase/3'-5' exonuclease PolX [Gemmatales bacterium]
MDKSRVAAILDEIGTLLELKGENPFRANAYHNAARAIEQLEGNLEELVAQKRLGEIKGIGESMQEKITTLMTTGRLPYYEELRASLPHGLVEMLRIPGLGPKKVKALYDELGIDSLEKLRTACQSGRVAELRGFGAKTQQKILEGLQFLDQTGKRFLLSEAQEIAHRILEHLRNLPGVLRSEVCGSLRRRKETIGDLDVLVSSQDAGPIMDAFVRMPEVAQIVAHGTTKSSVVLENGMNCDLRVVSDEQFPFALHYFTGSKEHNIAMRARAQSYGLKLNEYELAGPKRSIPCKDEADIFKALDLDYIPPELRENTGEIEAAAAHQLPDLIEVGDLRGTFHVHTDWSDGAASLEEMALAAKKLGLKYLGIADHSPSLTVANGLSPERVRRQHAEIDALNQRLKGIRLLKGTECDILPDGQLDYDDKVLASFDYVVASVHSHFNQSQEEMTRRIVRALMHPKVLMLGHATGRLLLRREGYKVDLDQILRVAAEQGKIIEINANPYRLDLDWIHCKHAKSLGVMLVINPDAHAPSELKFLPFGIDVARRGWLTKKDVLNTLPLSQVLRRLGVR